MPRQERVFIGADLNGHAYEGNTSDEEVMGKHGNGQRNAEGQTVVDFAKRMETAMTNTNFKKEEDSRATYTSGGRSTQIDSILRRRRNLKELWDSKAIAGEDVTSQHRVVVCRISLQTKPLKTKRHRAKDKMAESMRNLSPEIMC